MTAPIRTCLGCKKKANQEEMIRIVLSNGQVVPDLAKTLPGRGAYLHQQPECIKTAIDRRLFTRALRVKVAFGTLPIDALLTTKTVLTAKSGV